MPKGIRIITIFFIAAGLIILTFYSTLHFGKWVSLVSSAGKPANDAKLFGGRTCYVDRLNQFNIQLLSGWHAGSPPDPNAISGASIFYNYNPEEIKGDHGYYDMPAGATKIQITSAKLSENQTFEQWFDESISEPQFDQISGQSRVILATPTRYSVGQFNGMAYTLRYSSGKDNFVIAVDAENGLVLLITISPANSQVVYDALLMLSTIHTSNIDICSSSN